MRTITDATTCRDAHEISSRPRDIVTAMTLETVLWREATLAADVDAFLARVGAGVLDALDATAIAVRVLVVGAADRHVDTIAAIRRGALGVARPAKPRTAL